jgi:hypothetical protein
MLVAASCQVSLSARACIVDRRHPAHQQFRPWAAPLNDRFRLRASGAWAPAYGSPPNHDGEITTWVQAAGSRNGNRKVTATAAPAPHSRNTSNAGSAATSGAVSVGANACASSTGTASQPNIRA